MSSIYKILKEKYNENLDGIYLDSIELYEYFDNKYDDKFVKDELLPKLRKLNDVELYEVLYTLFSTEPEFFDAPFGLYLKKMLE